MENLFRFILVRPAIAQDPANPSIDLTQQSAFQGQLREVVGAGGDTRGTAKNAAAGYVASPDFFGGPNENPLAAKLTKLGAELDNLETKAAIKNKDVASAVTAAFGSGPSDVVKSAPFRGMVTRLRDSILAIKLLQEEHSRPIEELVRQLRTADIISKADGDAGFPADPAALRRYRRRSLQLPLTIAGNTVLSTRDKEDELRKQRQTQVDDRQREVAHRVSHYRRLSEVVKELASLPATHFHETVQKASSSALPPERLRLTSATELVSGYANDVRALHLEQMRRGTELRSQDLRTAELRDRLATAGQSPPTSPTPLAPPLAWT